MISCFFVAFNVTLLGYKKNRSRLPSTRHMITARETYHFLKNATRAIEPFKKIRTKITTIIIHAQQVQ